MQTVEQGEQSTHCSTRHLDIVGTDPVLYDTQRIDSDASIYRLSIDGHHVIHGVFDYPWSAQYLATVHGD